MLTITRTANAGVLLEMDGVRLLLDGVCRQVKPYLPTPEQIRLALEQAYPDCVAVTHRHPDHYDAAFVAEYEKNTGKTAIDPTFVGSKVEFGAVSLMPVASRHIGKFDCPHASFVICGSRCVWFMGDASPSQWREHTLPAPDVIIAPFAYANTAAAWRQTQRLGAKQVVIVHMPPRQEDPMGLWQAVEQTAADRVFIPQMEEFIQIDD